MLLTNGHWDHRMFVLQLTNWKRLTFVAIRDKFPSKDLGWHWIKGGKFPSGIRLIKKNIMLELNWL